MAENEKLLIRVKDARAALGIGNTKFWALVKAGKFDVRKLDGCTVITAESLRRFADDLPKAA